MKLIVFCTASSLTLSAVAIAQNTTSPAISSTEEHSDDIIMSAWLDPTACNIGNATPVTFEQALRAEKSLDDKCVAVEGFWSGRALFRTAADANSKRSNMSERLSGRRLGIYGSEQLLTSAPTKPKRYTFVGQLHQCDTAWPGAIMVMGYCHYTTGPFLIASEAHTATKKNGR